MDGEGAGRRRPPLRASLETGRLVAPAVNPALLAGLAEAIDDREVVRFDYSDRRGEESRRRVEPHRQIHLLLRWYLLGWDLDRDDWQVFRLDRVRDLVRTGVRHALRDLPADAALAYLRQGLNADRRRVRLVVRARPDRVADALKFEDAEIHPGPGERETRVTVWLDSWERLVLGLAHLDADFSVLEPEDFRGACAAFARRLLAASGHPEPPST
ncbi:WYL domain-containing protein [Microbispora amethystogenes]|uniref:helix-turn-helix transcriptional regulator n=1 Tax=Microbispora amethystogenes TaxID=1427754 RepID=UPI0033C7D057